MSVRTHWLPAALAAIALQALPAMAASEWQSVTAGAGSSVEIDKGRIARLKGGKTAAWSRLTLDHAVLDFENQVRYTAVEALNHYDCAKGSFATQKRVFLIEGTVLKTEKVSGPPLAAKPGSVDARLLDEACKPRTMGEVQAAAARAEAAARAAEGEKPRPMHAEMVSNADSEPVRSMKVADAKPDAKAAAPAAAPVPAAPPAGEKPRMFDMPLIDKSKAEDPFKNAPPPAAAAAKPEAKSAPAPAPVPAPAAKAPVVAPKPALPVIPPQVQDLSRQQRELMLATSGPRKLKPVAKPAAAPAAPPAPDYSHVHWGYAGEGAPENWARLRPEYATCGNGKRQSPIDIRGGIRVDLEPIRFDYRPSAFTVIDNGHTIQVNVGEGSGFTLTGRNYQLVQFHFHRPAEERINGKSYEMVAHLVHREADGSLAVLAVLLERGMENPVIQTIWNHMPLEVGQEVSPPEVALDLAKLLPEKREYYAYMGSLTTPPCTENVLWLVLKQPVAVSPEQIGIFSRLYPYNARPVQPANDRLIKESR